jgi:uncharacterized membrane protein YkoI
MLRKWIIFGIAAFAAAGGTACADNAKRPGNDAAAIASARISLVTAVTTAEQHVQGKAVRAEYEQRKDGQWVYEIEVAAPSGVFDVKIDADKGTVIASTVDKADTGEDKDD